MWFRWISLTETENDRFWSIYVFYMLWLGSSILCLMKRRKTHFRSFCGLPTGHCRWFLTKSTRRLEFEFKFSFRCRSSDCRIKIQSFFKSVYLNFLELYRFLNFHLRYLAALGLFALTWTYWRPLTWKKYPKYSFQSKIVRWVQCYCQIISLNVPKIRIWIK